MSSSLQSLKNTLKGTIATEGDPEYNVKRWADNASRKAKYVVYPIDAEDVSKAILFAKSEKLDLAIRGGGHSTSGASSTEGGLVIDLNKHLNGVRVDAEKKLAYTQGGAIWQTVDEEAIKHGLAGCAGIVNHTGVGGLTLGGGLGYKMGLHGLVSDNLVGATMVVASGEILNVNENENTDLFWAIRGGGGNFGVVTEFIYRLHDQEPETHTSLYVFPPTALPALCSELKEWVKTQRPQDTIFLVFGAAPDGKPMIVASCVSISNEVEGKAAFERFASLGPVLQMSRQIPYQELNAIVNHTALWGGGKLFGGTHVDGFSLEMMQAVFDARLKFVTEYPTAVQTSIIWEFYHTEKMASVPSDATAFVDRHKGLNVLVNMGWVDESFNPFARAENRKLAQTILANSPGHPQQGLGYGNYGDTDATGSVAVDKAKKLFGSNYPRLQEIKKKYDPDMLFNKWFPITPAS